MAHPEKPDRPNRIVLIVLGVLAAITIGATIFATTSEWNQPALPDPAVSKE